MKKLAILLVFVTCIFSIGSTGFAEDVDLAGMSFDDLMELRNRINDEIEERVGNDEVPLLEGYYVVGTDISEGSYEIKDHIEPDDTEYSNAWTIQVFQSQDRLNEYIGALREYEDAYFDSRSADSSSNEEVLPEQPRITDYLDDLVYISSGKSIRVTLNEGQVMRVVRSFSDSDLTIAKSPGLFMN